MIDINIKGALYGIKYALPLMEQQKSGHIITTDSVAVISLVKAHPFIQPLNMQCAR